VNDPITLSQLRFGQTLTSGITNDLRKVRAALDWFAKPDSWTQKVMARDADGEEILYTDKEPQPASYCMLGALCAPSLDPSALSDDLFNLICRMATMHHDDEETYDLVDEIATWNDDPSRTVDDVIYVLTKAQAELEAELSAIQPSQSETPTRELSK
jgi:hypothetical protein